jgi:hypothetical protein
MGILWVEWKGENDALNSVLHGDVGAIVVAKVCACFLLGKMRLFHMLVLQYNAGIMRVWAASYCSIFDKLCQNIKTVLWGCS